MVQAVGGDAGVGAGVSDDGARDGEGVILEVGGHTLYKRRDLFVVLQPFDPQLVHLHVHQYSFKPLPAMTSIVPPPFDGTTLNSMSYATP